MSMHAIAQRGFRGPQRQGGMIAMIIAIIVLVSTLLAIIGLMRSVDTSNLIAGSLSFRQGVVQEAERAYSVAKSSIPYGSAGNTDNPGVGYSATLMALAASGGSADTPTLPAVLAGDTPTGGVQLASGNTGNTVTYLVERLCRSGTVVASKVNCVVPGAQALGRQNDESGSVITPGAAEAAYRLTVRVDGPRKALAFVQTIIR